MKRGVFDVLRRGLDNTLANWQLIAIRLVETILIVALTLVTAIAIIVPILVSIGIHFASLKTPEDLAGLGELLAQRWMIAGWILLAVTLLLAVFMAVHSFVEAGCARIYADGERLAGDELLGPRSRYGVFSMSRFLAGGKDGWWTIFWIYNFAWGLGGFILLLPLIPTAVLMLVLREQPPAMVAAGCIGLVVTLLITFTVAVIVGLWTNRAIAEWALTREGASECLAGAWSAVRLDPGRHLLVVVCVLVVMMAGSTLFTGFSFMSAFGSAIGNDNLAFHAITLPLRLFASLVNSIFTSAVTTWYLACFTALSLESKRRIES